TPLFAARGIELSDLAGRMVAAGYSGRKGGKGFYVYRPGRPAQPNRAVHQLAGAGPAAALSEAEVSRRLLLALVNEAVHALAEGVMESALAGEAGAVYGMGFPPFLGGPFTFIDQQGPGRVLLELQALEQKEGARFAPAPMLKEMA